MNPKRKRRRFNKVRFKRKVCITLILTTIVVICFKACTHEPERVEASEPFIPPVTYTYIPYAHYPVPLDDDLQRFIVQLCNEYQINPSVVFAMIGVESEYHADCIGDDGNSFGLMQVQPQWHGDRMDKLGVTDLLDPYQNVTVGIDHLAACLDYDNGLEWALMAYNGGVNYAYMNSNMGYVSTYAQTVVENAEVIAEGIQVQVYEVIE